jgi:hypothetical protein
METAIVTMVVIEDDSTARLHDSGTMPQDMGRLVGPDIHLGGQSLGGVIYKCLSHKGRKSCHIDQIVRLMVDVDVVSPFIWFFIDGKNGASHRTQRRVHQREELPNYLNWLHSWSSSGSRHPPLISIMSGRCELFVAILDLTMHLALLTLS